MLYLEEVYVELRSAYVLLKVSTCSAGELFLDF